MKRMRFLDEDLEKRASVLLKSGTFVKLKKIKKQIFALYELYGYFVEVVVVNKEVKSVEFIPNDDTERLASYVKTKEFKDFLKKELSF